MVRDIFTAFADGLSPKQIALATSTTAAFPAPVPASGATPASVAITRGRAASCVTG